MAKVDDVIQIWRFFSQATKTTCECHEDDYPPWTVEIHGLSQALAKQELKTKIFWIFVLLLCITCGTATTVLVVLEYIQGPTATSTTIRLVDSLAFPVITVCPRIPDAFNLLPLTSDIQRALPNLSLEESLDLFSFWLAGMGFANMDRVSDFNISYMYTLDKYLKIWMHGYSYEQFYTIIEEKYGLSCNDFFYQCELGGKVQDCCNDIFAKRIVMRRGTCYQTMDINQTDVDDIGRLAVNMMSVPSITSEEYNFLQPQLIVYVNDNHHDVVDFPNFYLYAYQWNRMRFTARLIELLQQPNVCTNKINGKDYECYIRRWLLSNIIYPYNCTLFYIKISDIPKLEICDPLTIVNHYQSAIQMAWSGTVVQEPCLPGCRRWEYQMTMQQTSMLKPFQSYTFDLEASFNDLQYEYVKEVRTTTVPGFMSQIGGQFGFFLGLSIITFTQMILYAVHYCITQVYRRTHRYLRSVSQTNSIAKSSTAAVGQLEIYKVAKFDEPLSFDLSVPDTTSTSALLDSITTLNNRSESGKTAEKRQISERIRLKNDANRSSLNGFIHKRNWLRKIRSYNGPAYVEYLANPEGLANGEIGQHIYSPELRTVRRVKKLVRSKTIDESSQ